MPRRLLLVLVLFVSGGAGRSGRLAAQTASPASAPSWGWGRFSLFAQGGSIRPDDGGASTSFNDFSANLTVRSREAETGGLEYAIDGRGATTGTGGGDRQSRLLLWDAWVGGRTKGGRIGFRLGQMWLTDLGALGSVGGLLAEWRPPVSWKAGKLRLGLFGGVEPKGFELGYVSGVRKAGAYAILEGERARRHVLGFVTIRNSGLTERSVLTMTNFVPAGTTFFLYQMAEVDLVGPGGNGSGGLTYLFVNARWSPSRAVELQGLYHRGRSIDTRTITEDQLAGRPVSAKALEGFLFESMGGRLWVEPLRNVRLLIGYSRDRGGADESAYNRYTAGVYLRDLLGSGLDLSVSDNRSDRASGAYDSWYASLGRSIGPRAYLSADYSTALSVLRFTSAGGVQVESRPQIRRWGLNGTFNLSRTLSLLLILEETRDGSTREDRGMLGLTVRF